MQLTEHHNERQLFLRHADAKSVTIVDRRIEHSVAISATRVIENVAAHSVDEIDTATIATILDLNPEVVLLGTGDRAIFPRAEIAVEFLRRGVGLETMDNAAAARTFNVLIGEGRQAVAMFLLDQKAQ
jgi:uncharacterized protein